MKKLNLLFAASIVALGASAEALSPAQALMRVNADGGARRIMAKTVDARPAMTVALHSAAPELYVFAPEEGGLMIVGADSEAPALLGYSETYAAGDQMPPALEMMLEAYAAEIDAIRNGQAAGAVSRADEDFKAIDPICQTSWNQLEPYNELTPLANGKPTPTGCVATAMAQVINVHKYPEKCSGGKYSYVCNGVGATLEINFDEVTLDWANMLDKYNGSKDPAESRTAVATLMKALGYACQTDYKATASGASTPNMVIGMVRYFDYDDSAIALERQWFAISQWEKMVYDELAQGYPVFYSGLNNKGGGHAFVVDGYKGDRLYHLNWGWGGMSNGYFLLSALDPQQQGVGGSTAGYNISNSAIFRLRPGKTTPANEVPLTFFGVGSFKATQTQTTLGGTVLCSYTKADGNTGSIYNRAPVNAVQPRSAMKLVAADGTEYFGHCPYAQNALVAPLYPLQCGPIQIPADLPEGTYTCYPQVWSAVTEKYYPVYFPQSNAYTFEATVKGNKITFGASLLPEMTLKELDVPKEIRTNVPFYVKGKLVNTTDTDFEGPLCLGIYDSGKTIRKAKIGDVCGKVEAGDSKEFDTKVTLTVGTIVSGNYDLAFYDSKNNKIMSDPFPVQLIAPDDAAAIRASKLTCSDPWKDNLEFTLTVTASEGNFNGQVYIEIRKKGDSGYVTRFASVPLKIAEKDAQAITVCDEFKDGVVGEQYTAYVFYTRAGELIEAPGNQRCTFVLSDKSSINEIVAGKHDNGAVYDLTGRRVAHPVKGNIYIVNNQKVKF